MNSNKLILPFLKILLTYLLLSLANFIYRVATVVENKSQGILLFFKIIFYAYKVKPYYKNFIFKSGKFKKNGFENLELSGNFENLKP